MVLLLSKRFWSNSTTSEYKPPRSAPENINDLIEVSLMATRRYASLCSWESSALESTAVLNWAQKGAQSIKSPLKVGKWSLGSYTDLGLGGAATVGQSAVMAGLLSRRLRVWSLVCNWATSRWMMLLSGMVESSTAWHRDSYLASSLANEVE